MKKRIPPVRKAGVAGKTGSNAAGPGQVGNINDDPIHHLDPVKLQLKALELRAAKLEAALKEANDRAMAREGQLAAELEALRKNFLKYTHSYPFARLGGILPVTFLRDHLSDREYCIRLLDTEDQKAMAKGGSHLTTEPPQF